MTAPIHADMRDPTEGTRVLAVVGTYPPRPSCALCSLDYVARTGMPAKVLSDRAIVIRDTVTGMYRALVHCHGSRDVVELGDHPDELDVSAAVAFKRGQ